MAEIGWYRLVYGGFIVISMLLIFGYDISGVSSPYIDWAKSMWFFTVGLYIFSWAVFFFTKGISKDGSGMSIMPFGDYDPDTYPVQGWLGYNGAVVVALISGLILASFFGYTTMSTQEPWLPVPQVLLPQGLQVPEFGAYELFTGANRFSEAIANSVVPTFVENPALIFSLMLLTWIPIRLLLQLLGMSHYWANMFGILGFIIIGAFMFPFGYHIFSYQGSEVAYWRAFFFVLLNAIPVALTGIPIPMDLSHFTNNFMATYFAIVGFGMVLLTTTVAIPQQFIAKAKFIYTKNRFNSE